MIQPGAEAKVAGIALERGASVSTVPSAPPGEGDSAPAMYFGARPPEGHRSAVETALWRMGCDHDRASEGARVEKRPLGSSGPAVSVIGFGGWEVGGAAWGAASPD